MRARSRVCMVATLAVLASAPRVHASPPITEGWRPMPRPAGTDTSVERIAQMAAHTAFSTTTTGAFAGLGLGVIGFGTRSGAILLAGFGAWTAGTIAGPALGWGNAGYGGRAAASALIRIGIIAGAIAIPLSSERTRGSELVGVALASAGLTGVVVATLEAYYESAAIEHYVRQHGPGGRKFSLVPTATRTGAPGLALVTHFD